MWPERDVDLTLPPTADVASGAVALLPQYAFVACTATGLLLSLIIICNDFSLVTSQTKQVFCGFSVSLILNMAAALSLLPTARHFSHVTVCREVRQSAALRFYDLLCCRDGAPAAVHYTQ